MRNKIILICLIVLVILFIYYTNRTIYINCEITDYYENKESITYSKSFYINSISKTIYNYKYDKLDSEWGKKSNKNL